MNRTRFVVMMAALLGACGGGSTEETTDETTETTSGDETTTTASADIPWDDMTPQQRGQFMQQTVMPEMRAMFQEFDGERFAEFGCATCHGENAHDVAFQMPNGLAPLNPEHIPAMFESDQPMAVFMTQRVWPRMAELLGEPQYNPETHEGFSCLNCHATEGS
ncbi:MAG: hypothetical protein AB7S26_09225 [Sandaracinaceae bacterium]